MWFAKAVYQHKNNWGFLLFFSLFRSISLKPRSWLAWPLPSLERWERGQSFSNRTRHSCYSRWPLTSTRPAWTRPHQSYPLYQRYIHVHVDVQHLFILQYHWNFKSDINSCTCTWLYHNYYPCTFFLLEPVARRWHTVRVCAVCGASVDQSAHSTATSGPDWPLVGH